MPELIFIIIFSVFICGMFYCENERDRSRILRLYQKEAIENTCEAFRRLGVSMQSGAGKSALFHQAIGRATRTPPYFIPDERFHNKENIPYLCDILDQSHHTESEEE